MCSESQTPPHLWAEAMQDLRRARPTVREPPAHVLVARQARVHAYLDRDDDVGDAAASESDDSASITSMAGSSVSVRGAASYRDGPRPAYVVDAHTHAHARSMAVAQPPLDAHAFNTRLPASDGHGGRWATMAPSTTPFLAHQPTMRLPGQTPVAPIARASTILMPDHSPVNGVAPSAHTGPWGPALEVPPPQHRWALPLAVAAIATIVVIGLTIVLYLVTRL
eukprot:m.31037 g.31037  ORF g.31037 m.31037 type:complete len:223 (-) comp4839_c0_seq1:162-830(-)